MIADLKPYAEYKESGLTVARAACRGIGKCGEHLKRLSCQP